MPVTLPGLTSPVSTEDIRFFLRDIPDMNPLLDTVEFKDSDIERAMRFTMYKYNAITPISSYQDPAYLNGYVLLLGACSILLRSEGLRQLRNQVTAQDGNISPVGLDEKQALYAQWADRLGAEFDELAQKIKIQLNMESVYGGPSSGGFSSGYRYMGRYIRGV